MNPKNENKLSSSTTVTFTISNENESTKLKSIGSIILCTLGFHKYEKKKETKGLIDCGESILILEKSWTGCSRHGCTLVKDAKREWIELKKDTIQKDKETK